MRTSRRKLQIAAAMLAALPALATAQRVEIRGGPSVAAHVAARLVIGAHVAVRAEGPPLVSTPEAGWVPVSIPVATSANTHWSLVVAGPDAREGSAIEVQDVDGVWRPLVPGARIRVAEGAREQATPRRVRLRVRDARDIARAGAVRLAMESAGRR